MNRRVCFLFFVTVITFNGGCGDSESSSISLPSRQRQASENNEERGGDIDSVGVAPKYAFHGDSIDPEVLMERVISAHGGQEMLSKLGQGKSRIEISTFGSPVGRITNIIDDTWILPGFLRRSVTTRDVPGAMEFVVNKTGSWGRQPGGRWVQAPSANDRSFRSYPLDGIQNLLELGDESGFLEAFDVRVDDDKPYLVVRRQSGGQWHGDILIDPDSFLVMQSRHVISIPESNHQATVTVRFTNYENFDGVAVAMDIDTSSSYAPMNMKTHVVSIEVLKGIDLEVFKIDD